MCIQFRLGATSITALCADQWAPTLTRHDEPGGPLALETPEPSASINNFMFVRVGDGMSTGEKSR
ncbi:MAG TPA: hypothetical protein VJT81_06625 [Burkholderiales bacterium]|nr:hypothetical protein [Burkholderiales bacterium]